MKQINKYINNKTCDFISSNCVTYQGDDISCISICNDSSISDVIAQLGKITCYNYEQLNLLSTVELSCLSDQLGCDDKNLVSLFNLTFETLCDIKEQILSLSTGTDPKIILDFCTPQEYSCTDVCLFEVPCCSADEGHTLLEILQTIIGRVIQHSVEICEIPAQIQNLQEQIDAINTSLSGIVYVPPTINLTCTTYFNGTTYIPTPASPQSIKDAIELLDKDTCKIKSIIGNFEALNEDCEAVINGEILEYPNSTTIMGMLGDIKDNQCIIWNTLQAIKVKQDDCCRTDCDKCMDNYFSNIITNYGTVATVSGTTPYININHYVNTQALATCVGNVIDLATSNYVISDGVTSVTIPFDDLTGITIISGTINTSAQLQIDLAALNLDYLRDITIKMTVRTVLGCIDVYRELVPRWDNAICRVCKICLIRTDLEDTNNYSVNFDITYIGGTNNGQITTSSLSTTNQCINIDLQSDQSISISNIVYSDTSSSTVGGAELKSSCDTNLSDLCETPSGGSGGSGTGDKLYNCYEFDFAAVAAWVDGDYAPIFSDVFGNTPGSYRTARIISVDYDGTTFDFPDISIADSTDLPNGLDLLETIFDGVTPFDTCGYHNDSFKFKATTISPVILNFISVELYNSTYTFGSPAVPGALVNTISIPATLISQSATPCVTCDYGS